MTPNLPRYNGSLSLWLNLQVVYCREGVGWIAELYYSYTRALDLREGTVPAIALSWQCGMWIIHLWDSEMCDPAPSSVSPSLFVAACLTTSSL